jgi:putative ABC transport system ATP-binding protein
VTAPALEARSLYRFFHTGDEETLALRGVSLTVRAGEVVAVTGPSGSGKSTLLSCLAGTDEPDGGTVRLGGTRLSHRPEPERARMRARDVGVVFQSGNLLDHLTVRQNVELVRRLAGSGAAVGPLLESVGIAHRADARPRTLSGGEAARAALAVAMANAPLVLLADEPTGELDGDTEALVLRLLRTLADQGSAVVVASHSPEVARTADHVVVLVDGQVVA